MQSTLSETALLQNFIGGRSVAAHGEGRMDLIDPVTEQVYGQAPISDQSDVDAAYAAAAAAFPVWRDTTPAARQLALFRIADAMEQRAEEFADLESQDTGKPRASLVTDEIMLSVAPHGLSTWLHQDLAHRLHHFGLPVTVVAADVATR